MRRALALLVLALGAGSAQTSFNAAQNVQDFIGYGRAGLNGVLDAATGEQIMLGARAGSSAASLGSRAVSFVAGNGRFLGYQGAVAVSTVVAGVALNWYMQQAKDAIDQGSPKIAALRDAPVVPAGVRLDGYCSFYPVSQYGPNAYFMSCSDSSGELGSIYYGTNRSDGPFLTGGQSDAVTRLTYQYPGDVIIGTPGSGSLNFGHLSPVAAPPTFGQMFDGYTAPGGQVVPADPAIAEEVRNITKAYARSHPPSAAGLASGNIFPGVTMSPIPNANQVAGGPVDPTIDTDKDGVTDAKEIAAGTNPDDPLSKPKISDSGTTTTTVKNPDGTTTTTTTVKNPDGTIATRTVTTKTDQITNPDGSVTTTTTSTTTDVTKDASGAPIGEPEVSVKTDKATAPAPDKPATDEAGCVARGGVWSSGSCTPKSEPCPVGTSAVAGLPGSTAPAACKKDEDPPNLNGCNDFTVPRLLQHTGAYLKDLFVPCADTGDLFTPLKTATANKFPFSMTTKLGNMVNVGSGGGRAAVLPDTIGPFKMDWGWITTLVFTVGLLFKAFVAYLCIDFILSKLSGQVVMK